MNFKAQEARALLKLIAPILATQLAQVGMSTIDTLMSGYVSTRDLAAVAIGTSLWMPVWLFVAGVLVALAPMTAKIKAARQQQELPQLMAAALWTGIALGVCAGMALWFMSSLLPGIVEDEKTAEIAAGYTRAIAVGMPAAGIFLAFRYYAEAQDDASQVTRIMLAGLLMNVPLNALFVYGWFGLPALGGIGCGIGSSLVFAGMAVAMAMNTAKRRLPADFHLWQRLHKPDFGFIRRILRIGIPIGIAIFFEVTLFTAIALFLTDLGPATVAAHQIALNLTSVTFMVPLSIGMALSVRVSHWLGSDRPDLAYATAWLGIALTLAFAVLSATIMVLFSRYLTALYTPDPAVVTIATLLMMYAAVFQLSDATQVAAAGALRGYHDTLAVMLITFITYWLVGLGLGYWLAFKQPTPAGAEGFWTGLVIGLTAAALLLTYRLNKVGVRALQLQASKYL
ncbi:MAG: MATE family efflux transporter [Oceanospirillaceae bacterium]|uniref:MATE family efflux transporter n=1 Tax=unclassified Thalassolituus TaxID=2624967 RepID=UPI000C6B9B6A|nr:MULTISPECIES: MATE family efflux transporter [unclassified Thalassolituus]MAS24963.1 MATE family efflux transporter [Oceanospirillaceae bacterium]MBS53176.1 MATE family efflux transporter [Oceanospirillaceae bacterium]